LLAQLVLTEKHDGQVLRNVCERVQGVSDPQNPALSEADDVERRPCPRCGVQPGSPCRSRGGAVATTYHTGRFTKVPRLVKLLRVPGVEEHRNENRR
jgi:hypothetical protein